MAKPLFELLDDDPLKYTVPRWHARNLELYAALVARRLLDPKLVPEQTHQCLTDALIIDSNPAAADPQNAGHVRAQNANVLHYGLSLPVGPEILTISLTSGFIHDLNKAIGEPVRDDRYAVRRIHGAALASLETLAQSVGLNHLGDRTRAAISRAVHLPSGRLSEAVADQIDRTIVHHGQGSSRFIRRLLDGDNEWWGAEFVDPQSGARKLTHPPQPPLTLASVIHDLADSTQQMQAGRAWLAKYPKGFWNDAGLTFWQMLSSAGDPQHRGIPMSLRQQIEVETDTCRDIIAGAGACQLIDRRQVAILERAIASATRRSRQWVNDSPPMLTDPRGRSAYHDVGRELGLSPRQAVAHLRTTAPASPAGRAIFQALWTTARAIDLERTEALVRLIERAAKH